MKGQQGLPGARSTGAGEAVREATLCTDALVRCGDNPEPEGDLPEADQAPDSSPVREAAIPDTQGDHDRDQGSNDLNSVS